jgi:signal transduction histidine kinase/CheY-like chemotaxis protein
MTEAKLQEGLGGASTYELEIIAKDGRKVMLEVSSRILFVQGKPVGVEGIGRDISDRKVLEEELRHSQKMEAVGRLAGGIAHDFNNLLTAVLGHSELLLATPSLDTTIREDLKEIRKAGERAASLTRQLLAFSRKQILELRILDLNAVIAGMQTLLSRLIGEHIHLSIVNAPDLGRVRADQGQLEQVILNLAINARDAMPEGGQLTIGTANVDLDEAYAIGHPTAKPGRYVMIAVSDTGDGMDAATRARIFEPFFTTKEQGKGTGLGLSMVYGIIRQSDGYIWVYSEPGYGSSFKIYLPWVGQGSVGETDAPKDIATVPFPCDERVLVVEDEPAVRNLVRTVLKKQGYSVVQASDGPEALRLAGEYEGPIHLLLTDTVMPLMNGLELARRLSAIRPETRVLVMSGYTEDRAVRHGALSADTSFLQKPFTPDALAKKVREVLDA